MTDGAGLVHEGAEAVARADYDENQIVLWVHGRYTDARRSLLAIARDHFAVIHGQIKV